MADELNAVYGDSDSEADFDGFDLDDLLNMDGELPTYDAELIDDDRDLPSDVNLGWGREINELFTPPFIGSPGLTVDLDGNMEPLGYLNCFLANDDYQNIVNETNRYYEQIRLIKRPKPFARMNTWKETDIDEIKKFLGLSIVMGLVEKPLLTQYWTTDPLIATPAFNEAMPRDRFLNLMTFFHISNNETAFPRGDELFDPLHKIRPIYDVISSRFRQVYKPREHVCLDEGMVPWKGRLSFKQYIANKPDRFGVKLYILAESQSSYICDFDIYCGKDYEPDPNQTEFENAFGHSYHVVMGLIRRNELLNKGHTLYCDNYYTSPTLCDELFAEDTKYVGTVRTNRKEMPVALKMKKLKRDQVIFRQRGNLVALKWADKREVSLLSTKHEPTMTVTQKVDRNGIPIVKPSCVLDYNKHMGGVDVFDQLGKYYCFSRKSLKWWVKLFFHILNMAITNAYILYLENNTHEHPLTHFNFRLKLAKQLMSTHVNRSVKRGRPSQHDQQNRLTERHFPELIPAKEGAKKKNPTRQCVVCNPPNNGKRRAVGDSHKRVETRYWCPDCKKALCVNVCFRRYHTLVHYRLNGEQNDSDSDESRQD